MSTLPTFEQVKAAIRAARDESMVTSPKWRAILANPLVDLDRARESCGNMRQCGILAMEAIQAQDLRRAMRMLQTAVGEETGYGEPCTWTVPLGLLTEIARDLGQLPPDPINPFASVNHGPFGAVFGTPFCVVTRVLAVACRTYDEAVRCAMAACGSSEPLVGIYGAGTQNLVAMALYHHVHGRSVVPYPVPRTV